jgi:hypothetical protein
VKLSTRATTSWWRTFLPSDPGDRGPCVVELELSKGRRGTSWRVAVARPGKVESRDYSPLFAFGTVRVDSPRGRG